jgi:hypothetical protein
MCQDQAGQACGICHPKDSPRQFSLNALLGFLNQESGVRFVINGFAYFVFESFMDIPALADHHSPKSAIPRSG